MDFCKCLEEMNEFRKELGVIIDHHGTNYQISSKHIFLCSTQCLQFREIRTYISMGGQINFLFYYRRFTQEAGLSSILKDKYAT